LWLIETDVFQIPQLHKHFNVSWHVTTNPSLMKISIPGLFLRITIVGLIVFSVYGLLIQFIFSYFSQSVAGPNLTILNFAGPFVITILVLLFTGLRILFKNALTNKISTNSIVTIILTILLFVLIVWQMWYIIKLYKIESGLDLSEKLTDLIPMSVGLVATLFFATKAIKQKHAS
jgi:hypothetical protein